MRAMAGTRELTEDEVSGFVSEQDRDAGVGDECEGVR